MYPNATTKTRQTYLGMVTAMDDFVGTLVQSLKNQGMYEDTVIIFSSDNGGLVDAGGASNLPLKGHSVWKSLKMSHFFNFGIFHQFLSY